MANPQLSRRRGRPRAFNLDEAAVTAQRLFHARGFDQVGTAELAKEIGVTPSSLYAAFGNKAGLFDAALSAYLRTGATYLTDALATERDLEPAIRRVLDDAAKQFASDGGLGCMVMQGGAIASDEAVREICLQRRATTRVMIMDFASRSSSTSEASDIADQVMIALGALSEASRAGASEKSLRRFATIVADGLFAPLNSPVS